MEGHVHQCMADTISSDSKPKIHKINASNSTRIQAFYPEVPMEGHVAKLPPAQNFYRDDDVIALFAINMSDPGNSSNG